MLFLHLFHLLPWQQNRIGTINLCLAFYQCLSNLDSYKDLSFISSKVSLNANLQPAYDKSKSFCCHLNLIKIVSEFVKKLNFIQSFRPGCHWNQNNKSNPDMIADCLIFLYWKSFRRHYIEI